MGRLTGYFEEFGLVDSAVGVPTCRGGRRCGHGLVGRGPEYYERSGCIIVADRATHPLLDKLKDAPRKDDRQQKAIEGHDIGIGIIGGASSRKSSICQTR